MIETDHARDAVFNKNFFEDFKKVLEKHPPRNGIKITDFDLCDWRPMFEYFESEKAKKKQLTAAERKELKRKRDESEAIYTTCLLDGRKEKVGNFRVEPPGLFRGRGEHPKKGCLKVRSSRRTFYSGLTDSSFVFVRRILRLTLEKMRRHRYPTYLANGSAFSMIRRLLGWLPGRRMSTTITNMSSWLLGVR